MTAIDESGATEPLDDESDAALAARCNRGESAAWGVLVQRYQRLVYTIVRRIGLDDHTAADVFQTVFSRLITHLPQLNQADRLQAWIVTTAKREALLQRSRGMRTVSMTADDDDGAASTAHDVADEAPLPEDQLDALQTQNQVRNALERMDERCRTLLTLLYHDADDAVSYDEVAHRLDMPLGSVGPTRARCLGKLRKLLEA